MNRSIRTLFPLWAARIGWVVVLAFGSRGLANALSDPRPAGPLATTLIFGVLGFGWMVATGSLAFQASASLTIARALVPLSIPVDGWILYSTDSSRDAAIALAAGALASVSVLSGDLGASYVQASAYGAERRSLLRPPPVYAGLVVLSWSVAASLVVVWVEATADHRWILSAIVSVGCAAVATWGASRWHRLARRWLVVVPAGLVIHDHLVLADTAMLPKRNLVGVCPAEPGSGALDLTGDARGYGLEIHTHSAETLRLAPQPVQPAGKVIHATALKVAPSRPGRFVDDARRSGIAPGRPTKVGQVPKSS